MQGLGEHWESVAQYLLESLDFFWFFRIPQGSLVFIVFLEVAWLPCHETEIEFTASNRLNGYLVFSSPKTTFKHNKLGHYFTVC